MISCRFFLIAALNAMAPIRPRAKPACGSINRTRRKPQLESGATAIVPGKPGESALVQRILSEDASEMMPPADSGKTLSDTEKELLRRWIAEGAKYEKHWAFVAPTRPDVPDVEQPEFVANAIDRFVFARLKSEGVQPAPQASKERLITPRLLRPNWFAPFASRNRCVSR